MMKKPESFWQAATRILGERIGVFSLMCQKTGRRATADNIHDLRVSARRLAAAQSVFQFEALSPLKKESRRIRRLVGEIRDLDVAAENIRRLSESFPDEERAGPDALGGGLLRRRKRVLAEIRPLLRQRPRSPRIVVMEEDDSPFGLEAPGYLTPLLDRACDLAEAAQAPENASAVHRLRIAFKRLRYRLEIFSTVLGPPLDSWLGHCRALQDRLGAVHDLDVVIEMVEREWEKDAQVAGVERLLQEAWRSRHHLDGELRTWLPSALTFTEEIRSALVQARDAE